MELLQGESLATRIARGPIAVSEIVSTTIGMLAGIDALHKQGLIHRDLKPSNIFLTPHGVKLLDFGLTCSLQTLGDDTLPVLTVPGTGCRHAAVRLAPRPSGGDAVDTRTDLFARRRRAVEMLAGKPPFSGKSAVEMFHAIMF